MITLSKLEMSGFRGVRSYASFEFSRGFTILTGPNGSGKSSVLDAIEFALTGTISKYGEKSGEKNEDISDYEWWRGAIPATDHFVRLELLTDDGSRVGVVRRPDGVEIEGGLSILDLLCDTTINPESSVEELCRTSLIRDEFIAKNSVDLPETDRFSFVRSAVGVHNPSELLKKLSDADKLIKSRIERAESEYQAARTRVQTNLERLSSLKSQAPQRQSATEAEQVLRNSLPDTASEVTQLIRASDDELLSLRVKADSLNGLYAKAVIALERTTGLSYKEKAARTSELETRVGQLTNESEEIERLRTQQDARVDQIKSARRYIADLAQLHSAGSAIGNENDQCPLCGSRIDQAGFETHLEEIAAKVSSHGEQIAEAIEEQRRIRNKDQSIRQELELARNALDRLRADIRAADSLRQEVSKEAVTLDANYSDLSLDRVARDIEELKLRMSLIDGARRTVLFSRKTNEVVESERELAQDRDVAAVSERQVARMRRVEAQLDEASRAVKRLSAEAVEERLASIKPLFTELYSRLRPHKEWLSISYAIRGDVRRFLSLRVDDNLNLKFLFSSGQRRVTGLAFLISVALSRQWCKLKTLVLDDPVQHVDDFRAIHLVEALAAIRTSRYQIVCAVEDTDLADLLTRRLRSSHYEGGSMIQMRYVPGDGARIVGSRTVQPFEKVMMETAS